jgi:F-type H+-transporting ATPase subunit b
MKLPCFGKKHVMLLFLMAALLIFSVSGTALASAEGGHGEGAETKGWVDTDWYRVMNFAVLAVALFFVLRKPVSQALNGRIKGIQEELDDLEEKKKQAQKTLAEYDEKIAALDKEAEKIIARYIKQGEEARRKILDESKKEAVKLEEQAKRKIEHEFNAAKLELQEEILEKALARAEGLVMEKINSEDQDRLVDEYLDKVVAQ